MKQVEASEKLVEETRLLLCEDCSEGPQRYEYQESLDDPICAVGAEKDCNERARKAIARICQAVADGDLGLPNQIARGIVDVVRCNPITFQIEGFMASESDEDLSELTEIPIIALRPKEEMPNRSRSLREGLPNE